MIDWTKLRTKFGLEIAAQKFEELAFMYVQDVYSQYTWIKTVEKGDGNRDVQLSPTDSLDYDIWAEAKYRNSSKKKLSELRALERKDLDSTILSGLIHGRVKMIIFISNAKLPNSVMDRAMLGATIRGIKVTAALSQQLENWLIDHPKEYKDLFGEELIYKSDKSKHYDVESANIYDPISADFNPLYKKKDFSINEFAILNIIINSSEKTIGSIQYQDYLPFEFIEKSEYENPNHFIVNKGISNIVFLVKMKGIQNGRINVTVRIDDADFFVQTNSIHIKKDNIIHLAYSSQLEIIHNIEKAVVNSNSFENGLIVTLYAESSMGKSFVLRNIYNDLNMNYDMTLIGFDSNRNNLANYSLLCKSVLFLNFGNVFWDYDFSSKDSVELFKSKVKESYSGSVFKLEIMLQIIDGCYDSNIAASTIKNLMSQRKAFSLFEGNRSKMPKVLLVDDFQYLDQTQSKFAKALIEQLKKDNNSVFMIISSTKDKFYDSSLEKYFLEVTPNSFMLEGLSTTDKEQTIQSMYNLPIEKCVAAKYILPNSPLLAIEVIRTISQKINQKVTDPLEIIFAYSKSIDETQIIRNKFSQFKNQYYLLDIIYRFKKGITLNDLRKYYKDSFKFKSDITTLFSNKFVRIEGDYIFPYHDFYTNAYIRLRGKNFNNANVGKFLKHLLTCKTDIDKNHIISMLLRCGSKYQNAYEKEVQKLILKYVHETQFGVAIYFCEFYYEQIQKMNRNYLSHDQAYYLYLYADCLVHCGKQGQALNMLEDIYQEAPDDSLPKYEAGASVLTQFFWRLRPSTMVSNSLYIQSGLERINREQLSNVDLLRVEKAYDSCFNRRMMAYFLNDNFCEARKTYLERLKIIADTSLNLIEFRSKAATLIMDYARSIVIYNQAEAYRLLQLSLRYFESDKDKHYRRILICNVDCEVFSNIHKGIYNAERFNKYSHKLLEGQFYSEYFKSILKKSICSLIDYSNAHNDINCFLPECQIIKDVDSAISKTLVETELIPLERDKLLLAYIKSFIAICNNEIGQAKEMLENCIKMTNELGESYRLCLKHNLKNLSTITHIKWYSPNESYSLTDYLVDCRFW